MLVGQVMFAEPPGGHKKVRKNIWIFLVGIAIVPGSAGTVQAINLPLLGLVLCKSPKTTRSLHPAGRREASIVVKTILDLTDII